MAFNPFESLRKNSKSVMALLAIVCMFTFVLSSGVGGKGDFFEWFGNRLGLGAENQDRTPLIMIEGTKIDGRKLAETQRARAAANLFMLEASAEADRVRLNQIDQDIAAGKVSPETSGLFGSVVRAYRNMLYRPQGYGPQNQQRDMQMLQLFDRMGGPDGLMSRPGIKDKPEDLKAIVGFRNVVQRRSRIMQQAEQEDGIRSYFATGATGSERETALYTLLRKKADELKVNYTTDDIKALIREELGAEVPREMEARILKEIQTRLGVMPDGVIQAIGGEFRVRAARAMMFGESAPNTTLTAAPITPTPFEFYRLYKDLLAEVQFTAVEVPVEKFVAEMKDVPTEEQLRDLFRLYRERTAAPESPQPGFKQDRRIKLAWVEIKPNDSLADKAMPGLLAASYFGMGAGATMIDGGGIAPLFAAVSPYLATEVPTYVAVQDAMGNKQGRVSPFGNLFESGIYNPALRREMSLYQPRVVAGLIASLVGPLNPATPEMTRATYTTLIDSEETRIRVLYGINAYLAGLGAGSLPTSMTPYPFNVIAPSLLSQPPELPVKFLRERASREIVQARRQAIFAASMQGFAEQLKELSKKLDPKGSANAPVVAEIEKYIADFVALNGFKTGKSDTLDEKFAITDDAGLLPPYQALKQDLTASRSKDNPFSSYYEEDQDFSFAPKVDKKASTLYQARLGRGTFVDSRAFQSTKPDASQFMLWRIADEEPKAFAKYDDVTPEMKARIINAWKVEKARPLAQKAAEAFMAEQVKPLIDKELKTNLPAFERGLRDAATAKGYRVIDLPKFSRVKSERTAPVNDGNHTNVFAINYRGTTYEGGAIAYPTPDLVFRLTDLRKKPVGETLTFTDAPQKHVYAAIMTGQNDPEFGEFAREIFLNPKDELFNAETRNSRIQFYNDAFDRLKAEMKYEELPAFAERRKRE